MSLLCSCCANNLLQFCSRYVPLLPPLLAFFFGLEKAFFFVDVEVAVLSLVAPFLAFLSAASAEALFSCDAAAGGLYGFDASTHSWAPFSRTSHISEGSVQKHMAGKSPLGSCDEPWRGKGRKLQVIATKRILYTIYVSLVEKLPGRKEGGKGEVPVVPTAGYRLTWMQGLQDLEPALLWARYCFGGQPSAHPGSAQRKRWRKERGGGGQMREEGRGRDTGEEEEQLLEKHTPSVVPALS